MRPTRTAKSSAVGPPMSFDQIANKVLAVAVLVMLFGPIRFIDRYPILEE